MADAQRLKTLGQCSACVFDGTTREWPKKESVPCHTVYLGPAVSLGLSSGVVFECDGRLTVLK
jgi:hypothetical protein